MAPNNVRTIGIGGGLAAALAISVPFIAQHEGHASHVYHDIGGVLTVCYGHTGKSLRIGQHYSDARCVRMLDSDVKQAAGQVLAVSPQLIDHTNVLAATISFTYNVGEGNYLRSSVYRDFRIGQYKLGCTDMLKWNHAGGHYSQGLENRRKAEYAICMKGL